MDVRKPAEISQRLSLVAREGCAIFQPVGLVHPGPETDAPCRLSGRPQESIHGTKT